MVEFRVWIRFLFFCLGNLGENVVITKDKNRVTVTSEIDMAKRYE